MINHKDRQKNEDHNKLVVKDNRLIQKSRHNLTLQEQKIVLYLVSQIKPEDKELKEYEFDIKEFCRICGINLSGKNYTDLKAGIKTLSGKSMWLKINEHEETLVRWIDRPTINSRNGTIKIKIDEYMRPYLLDLRAHFTQYSLYYTLAMKNKYSIRFYELLKSYQNMSTWEFDFAELKKILFAEHYKIFYDFNKRVLAPALNEINKFSDISVTYELHKKGRGDYLLVFSISPKTSIAETIETWKSIETKIDPKLSRAEKKRKKLEKQQGLLSPPAKDGK